VDCPYRRRGGGPAGDPQFNAGAAVGRMG
jgi:hypothetical protein